MMKLNFKPSWNLLIVLLLATLFFISTSSFNYLTQDPGYIKWTSPDEAANYFFASRFSEGLALGMFDEAAVIGDNMVMPRSFRSDFGWLKPVSFLGIIIIYGSIGSVLGTAVIPFLTPFIAALGIVIFYLLIAKLFSKRIGLISATLLTFFPVYIYYTVRSMFHNVLFIVLILTAIYFLVLGSSRKRRRKKVELSQELLNENELTAQRVEGAKLSIWKRTVAYFRNSKFFTLKLKRQKSLEFLFVFLGGLFFGLGAITRTSELIWLAPSVFVVYLFYFKRFSLTKLILIVAGFFLAVLPNIYYNQLLYTAPLYGGYNEMNRSLDDISQAGSGVLESVLSGGEIISHIKVIYNNIFYFGFDAEQSIEMAQHYIVDMFPFLLALYSLGFLIVIIKNIHRFRKKYLAYFLGFVVLSAILIFYYGSWQFNDNPDPNRFTIGNSYTRYWLPIYLMMMPIAALAILRISKALALTIKKPLTRKRKKIVAGFQIIIVSIFAVVSLDFVLYGSEEGLAHLYYNNLREKALIERVLKGTEGESIIVTRYYDKFLFPDRRVIMGNISNEEVLTAASKLSRYYPVYYYNFYLNEADVNYLNDRKLPAYNLEIKFQERISHDFGLYSLKTKGNAVAGEMELAENDISQ